MKTIIVYSGKGGVGKTTTTANIARLLAEQGNKVFVIDADINTPSMNVEFDGEHPSENIWVHSSGNMFDKFIYLEKSMIRQYIQMAMKKLRTLNPDFILIDTPPSVTNVHIELLSRVKVGYVLFVTQPTKLSSQDVLRTMKFFHDQCGRVNCGIVENMCFNKEPREYPVKLVAQIPMQEMMDTASLLEVAREEFQKIVTEISESDDLIVEDYRVPGRYDESFDIIKIEKQYTRRSTYRIDIRDDNGVEKSLVLPTLKFLSVRTWGDIRNYIADNDELGHHFDGRMMACDTERVRRVVEHFQNDNNAYFMVTNSPITEIRLITGEIGICSLLIEQKGHYEIPRVSYQTSKGNVVLFPDEIMPVTMEMIQQQINEGFTILSDGRYMPPKETVAACYDFYGPRVGLTENWEEIYDEWVK